jgi:hypothetical protein
MVNANPLSLVTNNREFDLHVLKHVRPNEPATYTIGVWEGKTVRAICHIKRIAGALLAITKECEETPEDHSPVSYPRWSEVASLVRRLSHRADTDCIAAGEYIEDLHARLHNTTAELETALERLEKLGALIEEAGSKAQVYGLPDNQWAGIPAPVWFRLQSLYLLKQEGEKGYQELRRLREVAGIAAETLRTVDNWLGNASTREAAMEALWRFRRILEAVGYPMPLEHFQFRGQLTRAMEESGVGLGVDGVLRLRQPTDKNYEPASGPPVKEILQAAVQQAV